MAASVPQENTVPATQEDFERIFRYPTLDKMLALSWRDFERFIAHVFVCAGYRVEDVARDFFPDGPGVDLNLYTAHASSHASAHGGGAVGKTARPVARVEIKRWRQPLRLDHVRQFIGTLRVAGDIPGYMISTGGFEGNAQIAAEMASSHVRLIDGARLLRYIAYVGGSRLNGVFAGGSVAPQQPTSPAWLERGDEFARATARPPQGARTTRVLAVLNTKGGVAKTTTALNVGFALSDRHQQRVLMVDLDGQASLTRSLPPRQREEAARGAAPPPPLDTASLAHYLRGQRTLEQLIRPTRFERLWVAPASRELYHLQFAGADRARMEIALAQALRTAKVRDEAEGREWGGSDDGDD